MVRVGRGSGGVDAQLLPDRRNREGSVYLAFIGPLRAADGRPLKVDVATNEVVREKSVERRILSDYSDLDGNAYLVDAYSLVEIWAEKTRALMQRSEPRDLYDLGQLLVEDGTLPGLALDLFGRKARAKDLDPTALLERLAERETTFERMWTSRLSSQVAQLDKFDGVWRRVLRGLRHAGY
jgi:predicted nucleotidyltransferase component of viral defense system